MPHREATFALILCQTTLVPLLLPLPCPLLQKEVIETYRLVPVDELLLTAGCWRYCFWVRVKGICRRALIMALVNLLVCGRCWCLPLLLTVAAAILYVLPCHC